MTVIIDAIIADKITSPANAGYVFIDHLSHSGDLLLLALVRRRSLTQFNFLKSTSFGQILSVLV